MTVTVADVISTARGLIGDAGGARADTTTCEGYVRDALNIVLGNRPDLFLGQFVAGVSDTLDSADTFPIAGRYKLAVAAYVATLIESQDDQSSDRARGELMAKLGGSLL